MARFNCIICSTDEQSYLFSAPHGSVYRCSGCGLVRKQPQDIARGSADDGNFERHPPLWGEPESELEAAHNYHSLLREHGLSGGRILLVCDLLNHPLAYLLKERGYTVTVREPAEVDLLKGADYDCVILFYCLEKNTKPQELLASAAAALKSSGLLMLGVPSLDSLSAKIFQRRWTVWHPLNLFYFSRTTLQLLLETSGFDSIWSQPDVRSFSLQHMLARTAGSTGSAIVSAAKFALLLVPPSWRDRKLKVPSSGMVVVCRKAERRNGAKLSIIMPAYNEKATIGTTLTAVLYKQVEGITEKEVILVESNSTDGTRDIVSRFDGHPSLKIVYEEKPQGKGHAVRTGFKHATGDFILIQDADNEYDINDYDELLKPLLTRKSVFVLGSRHQGNWKMRTFTDRPHLAVLFNFGHILFTELMNILYRQRMNDPFTMYKVFRRECLHGLLFECNRFDFDHELVIKLLLKGYTPLEIPVNYCSRSYSEGKKVTIVMDPLLWIKANFKYRFTSPFKPLAQILAERQPIAASEAGRAATPRDHETAAHISFDPEQFDSHHDFAPSANGTGKLDGVKQ